MREAYRDLLIDLHYNGVYEENARTGVGITMLEGGYSFKVDLGGRLPIPGNRRYWPRVAAAEVAWQFMGTKDPEFILRHAPKLWEKFVEDGELRTAYGYRWRSHFGRDQLALAMKELRENPTNRQLYVSAWDPRIDGLGGPQPRNIPCPVGFSLTRTQEELHCSVFIRSSDVFVGLPYDVMVYSLTVDAVASSCGLRPGTLHVTLAHPHYYNPHGKLVRDCIEGGHSQWELNVEPGLPAWSVDDVLQDPDGYVTQVHRCASRVNNNEWNPMPKLVL